MRRGKKLKKSLLLIFAVLLMGSLVLTGCGSASKDKLNKLVDEINAQSSGTKISGMGVKISAKDDNKLVYTYTYEQDFDADQISLLKTQIETSLKDDQAKATFESAATKLKDEGIKDAKVVVEYMAKDGKEIYSTEFEPGK